MPGSLSPEHAAAPTDQDDDGPGPDPETARPRSSRHRNRSPAALRQDVHGRGVARVTGVGRDGPGNVGLDPGRRVRVDMGDDVERLRRAPAASDANDQQALPPINVAPGAETNVMWDGSVSHSSTLTAATGPRTRSTTVKPTSFPAFTVEWFAVLVSWSRVWRISAWIDRCCWSCRGRAGRP